MSSALFGMPGLNNAQPPQKPKTRFQLFRESPAYTIIVNGALFIAGVALIQSPLMDMLSPQLQ